LLRPAIRHPRRPLSPAERRDGLVKIRAFLARARRLFRRNPAYALRGIRAVVRPAALLVTGRPAAPCGLDTSLCAARSRGHPRVETPAGVRGVSPQRFHLFLSQRLYEVIAGARVAALEFDFVGIHGAHDDDGNRPERRFPGLHQLHQLHPVHLGHHDIGQDQIHGLRRRQQRVDGLRAVHRGGDCLG